MTMQAHRVTPTHSLSTRATALMLVVCMLAGMLIGSGITLLMRGNSPLPASLITQLILQDVCRAHTEADPNQATADGPAARFANATATGISAQSPTATTGNDDPNSMPASKTGGHQHCAACLIALDTALPEHGATWRAKSLALALKRQAIHTSALHVHAVRKPPSQGPPLTV